MKYRDLLAVFAVAVASLTGCGGGGGGGSSMAAPSDLHYSGATSFTIGASIVPLTPAVSGTVTGYAVSPALPKGLTLDTGTGVISGTPTAITAKASYTVTASNAGGSTEAMVSLAVNDIVPAIGYANTSITFATQYRNVVTPSSTGGAVVAWSISPALPPGLTFSTTTGSITNTATVTAPAANYMVTAQNSGGQSSAQLTIQVVSGVLLDLGHASTIKLLQASGARALSEDDSGHWVLWNSDTDAVLTSGQLDCTTMFACIVPVAIAGQTVIIPTGNAQGFQILAGADGHVTATIAANYDWVLPAVDGSYVVAGSSIALQAWSPTGTLLYKASGDYSLARAFPAPGQIQVALGAAGQNVIETVSLATLTPSSGPPFQGQFSEWFRDGSHFQSSLGGTLWTYSSQSVQQDLTNPSPAQTLAGAGSWFWATSSAGVSIYRVGASAAPAATIPGSPVFVSGLTLGIQNGTALTVVDLSGASLSSTVSSLALPNDGVTTLLATSATDWYGTTGVGVLEHATSSSNSPKVITLGQAWGLGAGGGLAAVGTASGTIYIIDVQTKVVQTSIAATGGKIQMSSDGKVLAVLGQPPNNPSASALTLYSLPSLTVINTWTNPAPIDFSLAPTGTLIALQLNGNQQITAVTGGPVLWSQPEWIFGQDTAMFSPDGTVFSVSHYDEPSPVVYTYVYQNYTLTTTVSGGAFGWIDNSRLLVAHYTGAMTYQYTGATIYSPTGAKLPTPTLPDLGPIESVTSDSVYSTSLNSIYSVSTGALIFGNGPGGPNNVQGAVTAGYVVFNPGSLVLAVPY
jgi:Putative Ig domain